MVRLDSLPANISTSKILSLNPFLFAKSLYTPGSISLTIFGVVGATSMNCPVSALCSVMPCSIATYLIDPVVAVGVEVAPIPNNLAAVSFMPSVINVIIVPI